MIRPRARRAAVAMLEKVAQRLALARQHPEHLTDLERCLLELLDAQAELIRTLLRESS